MPEKDQRRQRRIKPILFLMSLAFSMVAFVAFDWTYSAAILRSSAAPGKAKTCGIADPIRHHAFKPNCTIVRPWGTDSYVFATNSLGFRDESVREVPLADARPRILVLGDSFTEGEIAWRDSYVGKIAAHFPQYDFLNGGQSGYSPSNDLNTTRMVLAAGVELDEVIVFSSIADLQSEAASYRDVDASGAVTMAERRVGTSPSWYRTWRTRVAKYLLLTNDILEFFARFLVRLGYHHLSTGWHTDLFDMGVAAWTYRKVDEINPYPSGYAPLGVEGGIAKEKAKMTLLWQQLAERNIAISIVVSPWPAQVINDTSDSRQVRIWREWCEGKCKHFISVFPAFFAAKSQCPPTEPGCWYLNYFIFGDHHYNAAGNALVADAVIKSLEEDPPSKRPGTNPRPEPGPIGTH